MSNKGMPSLLALLGLVAVAGYQNRDKLRDMIADARTGAGTAGGATGTGSGGLLDEIGRTFGGGANSGRNLKEGLELASRSFPDERSGREGRLLGLGWRERGSRRRRPRERRRGRHARRAPRRTGLSRAEIVSRLKTALPETINRLTPGGRVPDETEASDLI